MPSNSSDLSVIATLLGALLLLVNASVAADTLAELQAADRLRIKAWIEPQETIIARQQVKLQIEVATETSFSGGTRIGHFEIRDAIVMQREAFALNSTRKEGEKTWTVQQWTLVVYPQRSGQYQIPPVPLTLSILGEDRKPVTGQTKSSPLAFSATQPETLVDQPGWVATSRFEVEEQFDKAMDALKPGDALLRTIKMTADNLPAMMLPQVLTGAVPGIAAYAKAPLLTDRINRGEYLAERSQQVTYVIEKAGEYQLPEQVFYWWNLQTDSVETIVLPAHVLTVAGPPGQAGENSGAVQTGLPERLKSMLALIYRSAPYAILLLVLLWPVRKWFASRHARKVTARAMPTERWLLKQARQACREHNDTRALDYLFQWLGHYGQQPDTIGMQVAALQDRELKLAYDKLMQTVYTPDPSQSGNTWKFIKKFTDAVKKRQKPRSPHGWNIELKLN